MRWYVDVFLSMAQESVIFVYVYHALASMLRLQYTIRSLLIVLRLFCICRVLPLWIGASVSRIFFIFYFFFCFVACYCLKLPSILYVRALHFCAILWIALNRWVDFNRIGRANLFSATFCFFFSFVCCCCSVYCVHFSIVIVILYYSGIITSTCLTSLDEKRGDRLRFSVSWHLQLW